MIKLFGRMLPVLARANGAAIVPATEAVASPFRVLPHDIDLNAHLNNGRYLQMIDLNRAEWLMRTGLWAAIRQNRWTRVLGAVAVNFRRELRLWQRFAIETRLLGWDERWTYLEHKVVGGDGRTMAVSLAKAGFRCRGRWMSPHDLPAALPYRLEHFAPSSAVLAMLAGPEAGTARNQG